VSTLRGTSQRQLIELLRVYEYEFSHNEVLFMRWVLQHRYYSHEVSSTKSVLITLSTRVLLVISTRTDDGFAAPLRWRWDDRRLLLARVCGCVGICD